MENKEKNFMSAVIYVHNAEQSIAEFLQAVLGILEANFEHSEIICVNDGSDDGSLKKIRKVSKQAKTVNVSVLNMSYFHGVELAMNAGVDLAIGDFVLEFDVPVLDFEPQEIMRVYLRALEGYDIVSASPDRKQRISSNLFYFIFDKFTNLSFKMYTESFRVLSRRVINRINSMNKTIPYRKAVYANCGLKTDNIIYHESGTAEISKRKVSKDDSRYRHQLAVDTLILFTDVGYRFSMIMTMAMIITALGMALYSVIIYITGAPVTGWTTTILFLSLSFFGLFGILTIVVKYLQILVDLIFRKKRYSHEGIEKLTQ